ncbi:MAG: TolC family protein [Bacteroidota bacterium]
MHAQTDSTARDTSGRILTYGEFMDQIMAYHPIAQRAELLPEQGQALLRKARGFFDPYIYGDYVGKRFKGKNYYQKLETGVKVPTWFGIQFFGGYENNAGEFLNPEADVPDVGLAKAGIEFNLGRGLLIDKRRAELLKAQWYPQITEAERRIVLNSLVVEATAAYWKWWVAWHQMEVYDNAVGLAEIRFRGVKQGYLSGDEPAVDTLESFIQLQTRQFSLNDARVKYAQAAFILSSLLWDDSGVPLVLSDGVQPPEEPIGSQAPLADSLPEIPDLLLQHPELLSLEYKQEQLRVDRRWAAERLKPEVAIKAGTFLQPGPETNLGDRPFYEDNTVGISVAFPVFIRKARGELALADIEIQNTELKQEQKAWELENKVNALLAKIRNTNVQIELFTSTVDNYQGLLDAEVRKFDIGESSLFLINAREQNLIKARLTLLQLQGDLPLLNSELYRATGGYGTVY